MIIKKAKDNQIIKLFSGTNRSRRNYSYLINFYEVFLPAGGFLTFFCVKLKRSENPALRGQKKVNHLVNSTLPTFLDIPVRCTSKFSTVH